MFNGLVLMNYEKLWKNLQQQVILLNQRDWEFLPLLPLLIVCLFIG
jgi:hypothetical protein